MSRTIVNRNIVLLPPQSVAVEAIRQSHAIADVCAVNFRLNDTDMWTHISLHQLALPEDKLHQLRQIVSDIVEKAARCQVTMGNYSLFGETGVFWDVEKTSSGLKSLHNELVRRIDPVREGYIMVQHRDFLTEAVDIGAERRVSLGRWGNPLAMDTFWPHITLTSCKSPADARAAIRVLDKTPMSFEAISLHLAEVGPNGTCPGSLREFKFRG